MTRKPLQQLFDALHRNKFSFEEFLHLRVEDHYEEVPWRGRAIYKPSKTLKALHVFLNSFVFEYLSVNDRTSFAYRKGAALPDAVTPHANSRAVYQTDFKKFFDSITASRVRSVIAESSTPVEDIHNYLDRIVELTTVKGRLPIGFSTSPLLSNACLRPLDDLLERECEQRSWIYSRYADDIIISAQGLDGIKGVECVIEKCINDSLGEDFKINHSKSRLTTVGRNIKILGLVILPSGRVTIDKEIRKKVEWQLHYFVTDKARLEKIYDENFDEELKRLSGYISHIYAVDELYFEKLQRKFGTTVIDSFLHRTAQ